MKKLWRNILWFFVIYIWILWFYTKEIFGNITAEQVLFYVQYGKDNIDSDINPIQILFFKTLLLTSLILIIIFISDRIFDENLKKIRVLRLSIKKFLSYVPLLIFTVSVYMIYTEAKVDNLIKSSREDFIEKNYVKPSKINIKKTKEKNLILIYIESLEQTYRNEKLFGENLLKSLDALPGYEFKNFIQIPNTEWTIAAMVGSQCGIPLKPMFNGDQGGNAIGELSRKFLASAICLGDILAKNGYHNEYMQGASLAFAGKGKFLKNHGYKNVRGREDWLAKKYKEEDLNEWGLYDDTLMQEAKLTLDELMKSKKLFNLTILTVDTHFPNGYLSKTCKKSGGKDFKDIIKCSSNEVAKFVNYVIDKGYLENTNIVILGDHLTMPNSIFDLIIKEPKRSIYNKWISKEYLEGNRNDITHFDISPTILDFIGMNVIEERFGLGYSAFGKGVNNYNPNIIDAYFMNLGNRSVFYDSLWQINKN